MQLYIPRSGTVGCLSASSAMERERCLPLPTFLTCAHCSAIALDYPYPSQLCQILQVNPLMMRVRAHVPSPKTPVLARTSLQFHLSGPGLCFLIAPQPRGQTNQRRDLSQGTDEAGLELHFVQVLKKLKCHRPQPEKQRFNCHRMPNR